ncbi:MAG: response regulator [Planctomycetes bacterium]|nr:response regulator [Planctomycetota bacterium]
MSRSQEPLPRRSLVILMADDDAEDRLLLRDALAESSAAHDLRFVHDGEELLDYLGGCGKFAEQPAPRPDLIVLDLNMPRKDGREVLPEIKGDAAWRRIPLVVLTTSRARDDIDFAYDLGVNSYFCKPSTYRQLIALTGMLCQYWCEFAELPSGE